MKLVASFSGDNYLLIAVLFHFFFFLHTLLNLSETKGQSAPTVLHVRARRTDLTDDGIVAITLFVRVIFHGNW